MYTNTFTVIRMVDGKIFFFWPCAIQKVHPQPPSNSSYDSYGARSQRRSHGTQRQPSPAQLFGILRPTPPALKAASYIC